MQYDSPESHETRKKIREMKHAIVDFEPLLALFSFRPVLQENAKRNSIKTKIRVEFY